MVTMYNKTLNPLIWNGDNTLKDGICDAIRNIVNQFKDDLQVPMEIVDVTLVGSNASYNYTEHSDIDIHIVVNNEVLPYDSKVLKLLYNAARNKFNKDYSITIKGLPIELSIEDISSTVCSNGIYSVLNNEWIKEPKPIDTNVFDMKNTDSFVRLCDEIEKVLANPTSKDIKEMINHLYIIRKNSIMVDGEYGKGNLLFKEIRNTGLLQQLKEELYNILSRELTFESMLEDMNIQGALRFNVED